MPRRQTASPASKAAKLIGSLGGKARARNLTPAQREAIAKMGAAALWKKKRAARGK